MCWPCVLLVPHLLSRLLLRQGESLGRSTVFPSPHWVGRPPGRRLLNTALRMETGSCCPPSWGAGVDSAPPGCASAAEADFRAAFLLTSGLCSRSEAQTGHSPTLVYQHPTEVGDFYRVGCLEPVWSPRHGGVDPFVSPELRDPCRSWSLRGVCVALCQVGLCHPLCTRQPPRPGYLLEASSQQPPPPRPSKGPL